MVLLIIDTQSAIVTPALHDFDHLVSSVQQLIAAARHSGTAVIFVRHDDGYPPSPPAIPALRSTRVSAPRRASASSTSRSTAPSAAPGCWNTCAKKPRTPSSLPGFKRTIASTRQSRQASSMDCASSFPPTPTAPSTTTTYPPKHPIITITTLCGRAAMPSASHWPRYWPCCPPRRPHENPDI